jgi:hypothetical protein
MIIEEQGGSSKAKYGNKLIAELSKQMTLDFGKGFDERNLRKMRQFYLMYPIWDSVRPELTWTHYRTLIRIEEQYIRSFYMEEAIKDLDKKIFSIIESDSNMISNLLKSL